MSTYLALVQDLHREIDGAGDPPQTVVGQTGLHGSLIAWIKDAWADIQQENSGNWTFLRRRFTFNTVSGTDAYAIGAVTDVDAGTAIARFQRWHIQDRRNPSTFYRLSSGATTKHRLDYLHWDAFAYLYRTGNVAAGQPRHMTIDPQDRLVLGPTPNDVFVVEGDFIRGPQYLAADDDVPEVRDQYHQMIVYKAMKEYGFVHVVTEALQRAEMRYSEKSDAFYASYSMSRRMRLAGPLA